ncbi:phosphatase domain-containing protein [Qipengyuania nanhaisediminis]|uniref:phosphatase domain-containing protein n=1 Tax=Qipengyuania nanhaisediminis TaxID=604088 RepID=UPI0038B31276
MPIGRFKRRAPVRVQPFYGYRNATRLVLSARAIRAGEPVFEKRSFLRDVRTMARQYLSHEVPGLAVTLEYTPENGEPVSQQVVTDAEGYALFDLPLGDGAPPPERTRWEEAVLRWETREGKVAAARAYVIAPGSQTRMGIISDIDDTILETGITGSFRKIARNWKRVMRQMPVDRVEVPGAAAFYAAIGGNPAGSREPAEAIDALAPRARVRPVFYVSSSPWNLFSYLVTFKRSRGLPLGPIMLRDWGFNRRTLGKKSHGSHKREAIEQILETFPELRFALVGDDTQRDLAAFGAIAAKYPGRIAAVFIRAAAGEPLDADEVAAKDMIAEAGVPFWSGSDYREAKSFLTSAGLDFGGGVKTLVRAASEGEMPPASPLPPAED